MLGLGSGKDGVAVLQGLHYRSRVRTWLTHRCLGPLSSPGGVASFYYSGGHLLIRI